MATDPDEEQDRRKVDRDADVVVGVAACRCSVGVERVRLGIEIGGLREIRLLLLGHVGRAGRGLGVVGRVGGDPGVKSDLEL